MKRYLNFLIIAIISTYVILVFLKDYYTQTIIPIYNTSYHKINKGKYLYLGQSIDSLKSIFGKNLMLDNGDYLLSETEFINEYLNYQIVDTLRNTLKSDIIIKHNLGFKSCSNNLCLASLDIIYPKNGVNYYLNHINILPHYNRVSDSLYFYQDSTISIDGGKYFYSEDYIISFTVPTTREIESPFSKK